MLNARECVGTHDILFLTLDTLRYDVAQEALERGTTPNLAAILPNGVWELRHSPGNFTYAAHCAFFAGFLPTPAKPGRHPRLFAATFPGSETTAPETFTFDQPDLVSGLKEAGYHTICIGGVGFFNLQNALSRVLPGLFDEAHWETAFGVTDHRSTEYQVARAVERLEALAPTQRAFLFVNISALHQPNFHYLEGATADSLESHAAALAYVDSRLPPLFAAFRKRGPSLVILCSDHGTAYGEDGYSGHRLSHPTVWNVPYAEFVLPGDVG